MRSVSDYYEQFHAERQKRGTVDFPERIEFIRAEAGTGHDVIELGCRFGDLLGHFLAGNRVTGVDVDREALRRCEERYGIVTKIADLNQTLPFADAQFDVVVMSEVLEHLPYTELSLAEASRILRDGGKFVGSVPNGTRLRNRLRFLFTGAIDVDRSHLRFFSRRSLYEALSRHFDHVRVVPIVGRFCRVWPDMFANYLLFSAVKR